MIETIYDHDRAKEFLNSLLRGAVALRLADGHVIESVSGAGVRELPFDKSVKRGVDFRIVEFSCEHPAAVIATARSPLGKPYDNSAILGFIGRRDWQRPDSWFCSELVTWAFAAAGQELFRPNRVHRVTPGHLWILDRGNQSVSTASSAWQPLACIQNSLLDVRYFEFYMARRRG